MKRTIAVALATVGIGLALNHAIEPGRDVSTPQARDHEIARQYGEARRRELETYRLKAPVNPAESDTSQAIARDIEKGIVRDLEP